MSAYRSSARDPRRSAAGMARGMTLVEAVLAISLTVGLITAVYGFYSTTLKARRGLHHTNDTTLAQRRILDIMAEDLRSAMAFSTLQMGLEGAADGFTVARSAVPSRAVFVTRSFTEVGSSGSGNEDAAFRPQSDVQLIGYALRIEEDEEEGIEYVAGIQRTCQRTVMAEVAEEGAEIEAVLLSRHVRFLHVQYWDPAGGEGEGEWIESWQERSLPVAVRVSVGLEPLEEDGDPLEYPYETMWRVVALPGGGASALPFGGGGRGGRGGGGGGGRGDGGGGRGGGDRGGGR